MGKNPSNAAQEPLPASVADVRAQVEPILVSDGFAQSDRMCRFLRFAVDSLLSGKTARLNERTVGVEVFDRDPSYDPKLDPIVRVEAHRLRVKLAEYYATLGKGDQVMIELPEDGYIPNIEIQPAPRPDTTLPGAEHPAQRPGMWIAVPVLAVAVLVAYSVWQRPMMIVLPSLLALTNFPGVECQASLSADGTKVAFVWNGEDGNWNVYVKPLEAGQPTRLTRNPAHDLNPAWSPDGHQIAFLRMTRDTKEIFIIPAEGGTERRVAQIYMSQTDWVTNPSGMVLLPGPAWSPDGKFLAIAERPSLTVRQQYSSIPWMAVPNGNSRFRKHSRVETPLLRSHLAETSLRLSAQRQ